jgi:hypothetical protein
MKLKITKDFKFAHRGCDVVEYQAGTEIDATDEQLIEVALREKWATRARGSAPENKALGGAAENKGPEGDGEGASTDAADGQSAAGGSTASDPQA